MEKVGVQLLSLDSVVKPLSMHVIFAVSYELRYTVHLLDGPENNSS